MSVTPAESSVTAHLEPPPELQVIEDAVQKAYAQGQLGSPVMYREDKTLPEGTTRMEKGTRWRNLPSTTIHLAPNLYAAQEAWLEARYQYWRARIR